MYDDRHNARGDQYETHTDIEEWSYRKRQPNRHERRKQLALVRKQKAQQAREQGEPTPR